jgi:hypothetical protein
MSSRQPGPSTILLVLLIMLGLAGLHGATGAPRWDGPLHRYGVTIGVVLEVVFGTLLVITIRRSPAEDNLVAIKLRAVLTWVLGAAMAVVAVVTVSGLHLHLFSGTSSRPRLVPPSVRPPTPAAAPRSHRPGFSIPLSAVLYALLVLFLLAGVVLSIWWARRLPRPASPGEAGAVAEDSADLRQAVDSGLSALRTLDDARAAIIACYVAMEHTLAERGAARGVADTPDELLARATSSGAVRGTAAARLTALFYEARFSSHPLDQRQRAAAEQALGELAAALPAGTP